MFQFYRGVWYRNNNPVVFTTAIYFCIIFSLITTFYCVKEKRRGFWPPPPPPPWTRAVFRTSAYNGPWVWASIIPSECMSVVRLLALTTGNRFEFIVTIMQGYKIAPAKIIGNIQWNGHVEYWITQDYWKPDMNVLNNAIHLHGEYWLSKNYKNKITRNGKKCLLLHLERDVF